MTMFIQRQSSSQVASEKFGGAAADIGDLTLRPALLAGFQDLPSLRHDFPLVLTAADADGNAVQSLSAIVDGILREIVPRGIDGERLRREVLGLEDRIRAMVSRGAKELLSELWTQAEDELLSASNGQDREVRRDRLAHAREALRHNGEVIDCGARTPRQVLTHLWSAVESDKAKQALVKVDRLAAKLAEILRADFVKSAAARTPEMLARSVGSAYEESFDFKAMSDVLGSASPGASLPECRRRRLRDALSVLESQRFFAPAAKGTGKARRSDVHGFAFDSCAGALKAFEKRLPELAALVKAMFIAELEIENQYREAAHARFFEDFDEAALTPDDLAPFPSYLIRLCNGHRNPAARNRLIQAISSGLPFKILLQTDDILEELSIAGGKFAFGVKSLQLPAMAMNLNTAYVVQASGSHLHALRNAVAAGLRYRGPALFSIFSGAVLEVSRPARNAPGLAPYLAAAAAMESRAFPAFTYDPSAGKDWAARLDIMDNPQAEADWPIHRISCEDEDLQRATEETAFTFIDFVASDRRYAGCFEPVPQCAWHESMVPVKDFITLDANEAAEKIPYVLMIDEHNRLYRASVADRLVDAARRCAAFWQGLQELGGIGNSHARALLEKEKAAWEETKLREIQALKGTEMPAADAPPAEDAAVREDISTEGLDEAPSDEPYIETPRCTTCHECIEINNKMFSYDENMQAIIADLATGSFRQLVEAAENCQVCIIHPGKPWNDAEPGLDELVKRAEAFN